MFNLYNVKYFIIKFEMKQINLFKFFSDVYQRTVWKRLRAKISYLVSIANSINIGNVKKELLQQNLIRGKHLFCHFIIQAQLTSSSQNTHVYATLVAVINLEVSVKIQFYFTGLDILYSSFLKVYLFSNLFSFQR